TNDTTIPRRVYVMVKLPTRGKRDFGGRRMAEAIVNETKEQETSTQREATRQKMSIILYSGTVDKLTAASILATGGGAMDMQVNICPSLRGVLAYRIGATKWHE